MPDDDFEAALKRAGMSNAPASTRAGTGGGTRGDASDDFDAALQRAGIAGGNHRAASPSETADLETNAVPGVNSSGQYQRNDPDWTDTLADGAIGLGEGLSRGVGINPARAAGFLGEKGAQVSRYFGSDVNPGEFGRRAEDNARALMSDAHSRSPIVSGMAEGLGEAAPGLAAMAATGGAVNPITMGIATGALSGLGNSESDTLGGLITDAGKGAAFGGLAGGAARVLGGASKFAGGIGQQVGDWADDVANSPMTKKAAEWAGRAGGGYVGAKLGLVGDMATVFAGGLSGQSIGAKAVGEIVPWALRKAGGAAGGIGQGLGEIGASGATQSFAGQALTQQYGRSEIANNTQEATDAGRGNLLGEAALAALQHDPDVLGEWKDQFAKAAASPDRGAVNTLIGRLATREPRFRVGPMVDLQKMTAGF